jgi:hypothetical protein
LPAKSLQPQCGQFGRKQSVPKAIHGIGAESCSGWLSYMLAALRLELRRSRREENPSKAFSVCRLLLD